MENNNEASNNINGNSNPSEERIVHRTIESEMKQSYLDYSMSVIVGRALPDVRDGLKPVHRRVLYTMWESGLLHNRAFKKSANVVGNCMAKYHPHGDSAIYDTLVRLAQNFSMRYMLVNGQGNFGSIDGDSPAAMRYCVTGDTLLLTDIGMLPIENISPKEESNINLTILNYQGEKKNTVKFFNSGKHKTIKITTEQGYELEGTSNHPVLCWALDEFSKPSVKWKLLGDMTNKDYVILNRGHSLFCQKDVPLKDYFPVDKNLKDIKLPEQMNPELAFLLGLLVSEGSFHQNKIIFNNKDMVLYEKAKEIITEQFRGIQLYEREIKGDCKEFEIYHQKVVRFLKNIGLKEAKSDAKEIPFTVLTSSKKTIKEFLVGLFEGDGSVGFKQDKRHNGKSIELAYDSKSRKLILQLKIVLLDFGIVTTSPYKDKRSDCFKLIISGYENIKRFNEEIGFFSERKNSILAKCSSLNPNRMSKTDFIPYLNEYLRENYSGEFFAKNNFDRYNNLKKNFQRLLTYLKHSDKKLVEWILNNNYFFNKIRNIERNEKEEYVYSIKVDSKCHSFIANGFINHNTEARLNKLSEEMLQDIDKETVKYIPNFDGSTQEPTVMPSKVPNLLLNGSSGIAVGMATNIPPHNLGEVADAVSRVIDNPDLSVNDIMVSLPGPDFPTGGIICGRSGVLQAYKTGRGKIVLRARHEMENGNIIIKEIPYMVNKSELISHIASLVKEKRIEGIFDIRDESDREGIRVVIELKNAEPTIVLNQLFKHSRLQTTYGIIMLALDHNVPKVLDLKEIIVKFIAHRVEVVKNRVAFDLRNAKDKAHILEGLLIALEDIDSVITTIKESVNVQIARTNLISKYTLSEKQATAILEMRLQRLTSMEQESIRNEHSGLLKLIAELESILASEQKIRDIIKKELAELKENYSDERRTLITDEEITDIDMEDLIEEETMVVTITKSGYIKRLSMDVYRQQRRGGKGITATSTKEQDFVSDLFIASTHDYILFFTDKGQVHWLKVYKIPEASRVAMGRPIINMLALNSDEKITAFVPVKIFDDSSYLIMATRKGTIKKTKLSAYDNPRKSGIRAITLEEGDELIGVKVCDGNKEVILSTKEGFSVRFNENDIRQTGRSSMGVRGARLRKSDSVISMNIVEAGDTLFTITENGYGKRTKIEEYRLVRRGSLGVININCSERNGKVAAVLTIKDSDEVMVISMNGVLIRIHASGVSVIGRNTQGVRIIKLDDKDVVVGAVKVIDSGSSDIASASLE